MIPANRPSAGAIRFVPHLAAAAFGLGVISANVARTPAWVTGGVVAAGLVVVVRGAGRGIDDVRITVAGLLVALTALGAWWGGVRLAQTPWNPVERMITAVGTVYVDQTAERGAEDSARITVVVDRVEGGNTASVLRSGARIVIRADMARLAPLRLGDRLRVVGTVRPAFEPGDPPWWRAHLERRGIVAEMRSPGLRVVGRRGGVSGLRDRTRERLRRTVVAGLSGDRAAVVRGMALGGGQTMTQGTIDQMRAAGVWHLMAVSGQNIALVAIAVTWLLSAVRVRRRQAAALAITAIIAYCLVCDGGASVARAGIMGVLVIVAQLASRAEDRWYLLIVGLAVLVAIQPRAIFDPGLQLSFAAVVGLLALARPLAVWTAGLMPGPVAQVAAASVAASVATAPVSILRFEQYSVVGIVANVIAVPVAGPTVVVAMAGAVVGAVAHPLGVPLTWCAGIGADIIRMTASVSAAVPGATAGPGRIGATAALGIAALVPLAARWLWRLDGSPRTWAARRRRRTVTVLCGCVVIVAGVVARAALRERSLPWPDVPEVTVLDIGQGDSILLRSPDGHAALIDTGPPGDPAPVAGALRRMGVRHLDLVAVTHHQSDHDGALADVVRAVDVTAVAAPAVAVPEVRDGLSDREVTPLAEGQRVTVGAWTLDVVWPPADLRASDPNDASLVVVARTPDMSVLLTGDAEGNVLRRIPAVDVDVLKVSHHGSEDPNLDAVLTRFRPESTVISVGAANPFGHPTPSTLATLAAAGLPVWRTDHHGHVTVRAGAAAPTVVSDGG